MSRPGVVLCLLERDGDGVADGSLRALVVARSIAGALGGALGGPVTAVVFSPPDAGEAVVAGAAAGGVAELCVVSAEELSGYAPLAWARVLEQLVVAREAVAVVAAATDRGNEVMAHLGALTGLPVAANCVAASATGTGSWELLRHRWGGSLLEEAVLEAPCALLTVAADAVAADTVAADTVAADRGSLSPASPRPVGADVIVAAAVPVVTFAPALDEADLRVRATESAEQGGGMSLATARVVVGGGRGVGGPEGFAALEELAGLLGGVVGVSRVVTSQGWRPHRQQVGQTGTKISPELYLACGISGAIQHLAGCQSARHIVAVNTDPDAPIMSRADYAVIGDLNEVIPALVAAIREAAGTG
ncbi:MAG TPA: FAD-binding protein [Streptosporangiaceae bacterium]|nr:FAD-binding protein [Streptosporangiaceae bacterium]